MSKRLFMFWVLCATTYGADIAPVELAGKWMGQTANGTVQTFVIGGADRSRTDE